MIIIYFIVSSLSYLKNTFWLFKIEIVQSAGVKDSSSKSGYRYVSCVTILVLLFVLEIKKYLLIDNLSSPIFDQHDKGEVMLD